MTTMAPLPKDSPIMIAWGKYKATDEYANSRKWAAQEQHVDGSMWAAFLAGYQAHAPSQPAPVVADESETWVVPLQKAEHIITRTRIADAMTGRTARTTFADDIVSELRACAVTLSASPQPDREGERIATIKECAEWYDAHGWEMDPMNVSSEMKRALTTSNRPQATEGE